MPQFRLSPVPAAFNWPLSGDITQTINPWTWICFNINLGNAGEPEIERRVLDEVGSYGRQLGRIGDALGALVRKARDPAYVFTPDDERALNRLQVQLDDIEGVKNRYRTKA
jgi:hypothetical protein